MSKDTVGSVAAVVSGRCTGFVGYPQKYTVGETQETSFMEGVDQAGQPFRLYIKVPQKFIEAASQQTDIRVPEMSRLAETHRKATNPCYAAEDNSPITKSGGVLLAEQVTIVDAEKGIFECNWASILQDIDGAPEPKIGVGYLESVILMPFNSDIEAKKTELDEMNFIIAEAKRTGKEIESVGGLDFVDYVAKRHALALELYNSASKKWFVGVDVQYRRTESLDLDNEVLLRRHVLEMLQSNTHNGMYGGVILRPYLEKGSDKIVHVNGVRQINHQYDYKKKGVPEVEETWNDFMKQGSGWMKAMHRKGLKVDVIPVQRVNCGKPSNEKYAKEYQKGIPKQLRAFVDQEFHYSPHESFARGSAYLATPIAMRTADTRKSQFAGTVLLSTLHSFGKAMGNILEIDKDMNKTLLLDERPAPKPKKGMSRTPSADMEP